MDNFDLRKFLAEGKLFENVSDYADRIMGAGVDDPIGLIDFYDDNIEELPEPMDPKIFKANIDAIKAKVSEYQKMMGEGKLHEAMAPQDVVDIADTVAEEFTIESAEEGDFLVYSVGKMDADNMSFELDTDLTSQSPKDIDTRGVGEGWGGIFRIKPTEDGYEVRNAEKGGLVAMIDAMGNFKMLSAAESRAEMGMEENKEETKSNKMKKSELKEMIKAAFLGETEFGDALRKRAGEESFDDAFDRIDKEPDVYPGEKTLDPDYIKETLSDTAFDMMQDVVDALGAEKAIEELVRAMSDDDALSYLEYIIRVNDINSDKEVDDIPGFEGTKDALDALSIREEEEEDVEVDAEEEVDVDVETSEDEGDIEVTADAEAGLTGDKEEIQSNLEAALEAAKALGDQKLVDQIGNSITFFTRQHVVGKSEAMEEGKDKEYYKDAEADDAEHIDALEKDMKDDKKSSMKVNEVTFPMWTKINK